jgi:uncharacterized protein involved in exopolysaccharide biosynthesis
MQTLPEHPNLMDYLLVVWRRKWLFTACFVATVATVIISDYLAEPLYRAKATIFINENTAGSMLKGQTLDFTGYDLEMFLSSHFEMMTSRPVLEKVVKALGLVDQIDQRADEGKQGSESSWVGNAWQWASNWKEGLMAALDGMFGGGEEITNQEDLKNDRLIGRINNLKNKINIKQVRQTMLVEVEVEDSDPKLAMETANTLVETYIEHDLESNLEARRKMFSLLGAQLIKMRREMSASQESIVAFQKKEKGSPREVHQKVQAKNIDELNALYIKTKTDKMEIESTVKELERIAKRGDYGESLPPMPDNGILPGLYKDLIATQIELSQLNNTEGSGTRHPLLDPPQIAAIKSKVDLIKKEIKKELHRAIDSLNFKYAILDNREQTLATALKKSEVEVLETTRTEAQYLPLEQEVKANQEIYDTLLLKLKEADISEGMRQANIRMIEPALLPKTPIKPRKMFNLILGIMVGLMLGCASVFFLEYIDRTIRTPEQVEKYLALPLLCTIPKVSMKERA